MEQKFLFPRILTHVNYTTFKGLRSAAPCLTPQNCVVTDHGPSLSFEVIMTAPAISPLKPQGGMQLKAHAKRMSQSSESGDESFKNGVLARFNLMILPSGTVDSGWAGNKSVMLKLYQQSRGVKVGSNVYAWDVPKCELGDEYLTEISFAVYCGLSKVKAGDTNEAPVELGVGKRWFPWGTKKDLVPGSYPHPLKFASVGEIRNNAISQKSPIPFCLPGRESTILVVKSPPMPWLGPGKKALICPGGVHEHTFKHGGKTYHGRAVGLRIGHARDAEEFIIEGPPGNMGIRMQMDKKITLDYAWGPQNSKVGQKVNFHNTVEHPEWVAKSTFYPDGTIGPNCDSNPLCPVLRLGLDHRDDGDTYVVIVDHKDPNRLVFGGAREMEKYIEDLIEQKRVAKEKLEKIKLAAINICTSEMRAQLKRDGFYKIEGGVPLEVVREARKEINREIGLSSTTTDQFKAKTFASHPSILNLMKSSMAPYILSELLGDTPDYYKRQITHGQLALRFPGDNCPGDTTECSKKHFNNIRKHWHIDGCPNDFIPGLTDHYGKIGNFSILCGCLLSDVPEPYSGELCVYPGSHMELAE